MAIVEIFTGLRKPATGISSGMASHTDNKRRRTEEEEEEGEEEEDGAEPPATPQTVLKLPEGMRSAFGGRKYCSEDELTKEAMLQYLKAKGDIKEVRLVEVTVQTMTGQSFGVTLEAGAGAQVHVLKSEIKEAEGIPVHRQDLFVLSAAKKGKGKAGGQGSEEPLAGDWRVSRFTRKEFVDAL